MLDGGYDFCHLLDGAQDRQPEAAAMPYLIETSLNDSRSVSKEFDPPIDMRRKVFLDGMSARPPEVDPAIPKRLRVGKPGSGGLPHILGWSLGPWIVSEKVKAIIEDLEPGIHKFSSMEIVWQDTGVHVANYYLILDTPQVDCVDIKQTDWKQGLIGKIPMMGRIVLKSASVKGRHLWKSTEPLFQTYFVSDEFRARLEWENLDGWGLRRKCLLTSEI